MKIKLISLFTFVLIALMPISVLAEMRYKTIYKSGSNTEMGFDMFTPASTNSYELVVQFPALSDSIKQYPSYEYMLANYSIGFYVEPVLYDGTDYHKEISVPISSLVDNSVTKVLSLGKLRKQEYFVYPRSSFMPYEPEPDVTFLVRECLYYADTVSFPSVSVVTDKSKTISVTASPSKSIIGLSRISVGNTSVASARYSNGKITVIGKKAGKTNLSVKLQNGKSFSSSITVTNPSSGINYNSKSLFIGETCQLKVYNSGKIKWASSNNKVAKVSKTGKIKALKAGKSTITGKIGKKKYKCKVKVKRNEPCFAVQIEDYDTRGNKFEIYIKNYGRTKLTVLKGQYKVEDDDYKAFDRKIRLNKNYVIKPKKTKYISFKVQGKPTWKDIRSFSLFFAVDVDGKKYQACADYSALDSRVKFGKGWWPLELDYNQVERDGFVIE